MSVSVRSALGVGFAVGAVRAAGATELLSMIDDAAELDADSGHLTVHAATT